jgi:hypothetical protein
MKKYGPMALSLLGCLALAAGCTGSGEPSGPAAEPLISGPIRFVPKKQLARDAAPPFPDQPDAAPLPEPSTPEALAAGPGAWSIVLAAYPLDGGREPALRALDDVRTRLGLADATLEQRGKAWAIAYGHYPAGADAAAHRDLDRLRAMELDGLRPFENAVLSPPPFDGLAGTIPEYDLSTVKRRFGVSALYTLQVAVYEAPADRQATPEQMQEVRLAAERAAVELRREGDPAFYYHGPRRSMVTVGVFGEKEYDVQRPEGEHPRLTLLRRKYPYNLVNGATFLVRSRGQDKASPQPSFVVSIPN